MGLKILNDPYQGSRGEILGSSEHSFPKKPEKHFDHYEFRLGHLRSHGELRGVESQNS